MAADGREAILAAVRNALGARGDEAGRRGLTRARLERPPTGLIPARARQAPDDLLALFCAALEAQGAKTFRVRQREGLPEAAAEILESDGLPPRLRIGADAFLADLDWAAAGVETAAGPAQPGDAASLSRALAGAAETGTLFFASGADNPTTLNFLPETHIAAVAAENILGSYEEAWNVIRAAFGRRVMPRIVNLVSGPSRTADIEQTIVMGAHGPRRLRVLIIS